MNSSHTESVIVHAYAGWPGRTYCMPANARVPDGTRSSTRDEDVTCERCRALMGHRTDEKEVAP